MSEEPRTGETETAETENEAGGAEGEDKQARGWGSFADIQDAVSDLVDTALRGVTPFTGGRHPRTDLVRVPDGYWLLMDLPGVAKTDLEVTTSNDELTVTGERRPPDLPVGGEVERSERPHGRFRRTLRLPAEVDPAGVKARLENGVLRITVPRRAEASPNRVEVS